MKRNIIIFIFLILIATSFKLRSKTHSQILNSDSRVFIEQVTDSPADNKIRTRNFEDEIRNLENQEKNAMLKSDTTALFQLWSDRLVINTAEGKVRNIADLKDTFREGAPSPSDFNRIIDKITISENVAVVMGYETQNSVSGTHDVSGGRYTDVWMKEGNSWKLTARQAANLLTNK
jgi:hypothetical protein